MLSRFARASLSIKPSILYRAVTTSSNNSSNQAAVSEPRRYPHDAQERDMVNFPPRRQPVNPGKLRLGLIPDEWFQYMYNKTGVTGPYILFWGGLTTILSKEYFVPWVDTPEHLVFLGVLVAVSKVYGPQIGAMLDKISEQKDQSYVNEINDSTKHIDAQISENQALRSLPEANLLIHVAKRENLHLQLEAALRQRMASVFAEVKRRLDYQVALQNAYKRVEREQAINYILDGVNQSIGPAQEKEAFATGLNQLKQLSQKYAGSI